jgi:thiamine-phosphate pyrophosphorylase
MSLDCSSPVLYLITKGEATETDVDRSVVDVCEAVRRAVEAKLALVQIREKNLSARSLYRLVREVAALTRGTSTRLLVNDRIDVAVAAGSDGVHLTAGSIPVGAARKLVPTDFVIGVSTHSIAEIESAREDGADFVVYGPVFDTPGKSEAKGVEDLTEACRRVKGFPVIALGGVNADNFEKVISADAAGAAAIRWLNEQVLQKPAR